MKKSANTTVECVADTVFFLLAMAGANKGFTGTRSHESSFQTMRYIASTRHKKRERSLDNKKKEDTREKGAQGKERRPRERPFVHSFYPLPSAEQVD